MGRKSYAYKQANATATDGVYKLDVDGDGPRAPFDAYCDVTTDGGGWTAISYLRAASQWSWAFSSDNGTVGEANAGLSRGGTLRTANLPFNEKLIVYNRLIESGTDLGKQWMKVRRSDVAIGFDVIEGTPAGWTYSDSFGFTSAAVTNVCTHGCGTYAGHGMFHDCTVTVGWHGTQTGNYVCRDGNNICWTSRSLGCNVGAARCAYLTGQDEGVL